MAGISPKLPLVTSNKDGVYSLTKTVTEALSLDLKMIILTNPGEKLMDINFGVGLRKFLFEQNSTEVYGQISSKIQEQAGRYLPQVNIQNIKFNQSTSGGSNSDSMTDNNLISITIQFSIRPSVKVNTLVIPIS
jgi:phage baseplate assembly protein W